jgi:uncharacterized protein (DUF1499 family)
VFERKHKHIQDAEEREKEIKKDLFDFMDEFEFVIQNKMLVIQVIHDNRIVLDGTWKKKVDTK